MKKVILTLAVLYSLAFQCDPGTGIYDTNARDMEIITGIQIRAGNSTELQKLGNPNSKTGGIMAYPNPVNTQLRGLGSDIVRRIWFVPGVLEHDFQGVEFDVLYRDFVYPQADIESDMIKFYTPNTPNFAINVTTVPSGYYRVFYLLDNGEMYWDNIYVDHEKPFQESVDQLTADWN
mgnify:CR=1 FL=1